jgi:hypothetical protein
MNARISGLLLLAAVGALGGAAGCVSNPTADGAGTPSRIVANFDSLAIDSIGGTASFTAWVVDSRLTPLVQAVTFAVCSGGGSVASVHNDGTYNPVPPGTSYQAIVTGVGAGATCVTVSSSGLASINVKVTVP